MKKSLVFFVIVIFVFVSFGCNNGGESSLGTLVYNGQNFALVMGSLAVFGANGTIPESYDIDITLADGSGSNSIYLDLNSDQLSVLSVGTYTWSAVRAVFTLVDAGTFTGIWDTAVSGTVTVTQSGSQYSLQWNLTMSSGATASGNYTGPLQVF